MIARDRHDFARLVRALLLGVGTQAKGATDRLWRLTRRMT